VEARLSAVRSLSVEFEQEKKLRIFKETVTSRGLLLFERPDRLRWETRDPFQSILVVAGSEVAKFETIAAGGGPSSLGREADMIRLVMDRIRGWFQGKFEKEGIASMWRSPGSRDRASSSARGTRPSGRRSAGSRWGLPGISPG